MASISLALASTRAVRILPATEGAMGTREDRIWRDLAQASAAQVRTWLAVGLRRLAHPQTSARERAAVAAQVATYQALLARPPQSPAPTRSIAEGDGRETDAAD
jgi:hypothetical protein